MHTAGHFLISTFFFFFGLLSGISTTRERRRSTSKISTDQCSYNIPPLPPIGAPTTFSFHFFFPSSSKKEKNKINFHSICVHMKTMFHSPSGVPQCPISDEYNNNNNSQRQCWLFLFSVCNNKAPIAVERERGKGALKNMYRACILKLDTRTRSLRRLQTLICTSHQLKFHFFFSHRKRKRKKRYYCRRLDARWERWTSSTPQEKENEKTQTEN